MNKKIFYTLGTISTIALATTSVVSCGVKPPTPDQIFVKSKLESPAAGAFANEFYLNKLAEKIYSAEGSLLKEQKKAWRLFVAESLRNDNLFFSKQITKWVGAGYLQWSDKSDSKITKDDKVPKINRELGYNGHDRAKIEEKLNELETFKSILEVKETKMKFALNQMVIAKDLLTGKKTVKQLKNAGIETKAKQDDIYILDNKHPNEVNNYYFIKWLVENHPLFAWKEPFDKETQSKINMADLDTWNGQDKDKLFTNPFHTLSKSSLFKEDKVVKLDQMSGYQGLVSSLPEAGSTGRFDTSLSSLKSYKKDQIYQGFVQLLKGKGSEIDTVTITKPVTGMEYHPLNSDNVLMAYVIQILPKWHVLPNKKKFNEAVDAGKGKQEEKDKKKIQEGYFSLPDFDKGDSKDILLYAMIAKNLPSLIAQAKNFWTNNGFDFKSKVEAFKKTLDNQGLTKKK